MKQPPPPQVVDYQAYIARFIHNYTLAHENVKNSSCLSQSTAHFKATTIAAYIAAVDFNIPTDIVAKALLVSQESVANMLRIAHANACTYAWYSKKIQLYTNYIKILLPPTAGIMIHNYSP